MTTRTLNYVFSFLLILIGSSVAAQNGTVRGFIYEEGTGEPMIFTPIFLEGAQMGGQTDVNGYYSINKIPAGNYTLMVAYLGYDTLRKKIEVVADKIINEKLFVRKGSTLIREFEVSADKQEAQNTVRMGITKLTPKQITLLPAVGGDADLAQYLQVVPGVIFT